MDLEIIDQELREEFKRDFLDQLQEVERLLLKLEKDPDNIEYIHEIFRPFHTIKGNAGVIGEVEIQEISQLSESILDLVRQGKRKLSERMIEGVFESVDLIRAIVEKGNPQYFLNQVDELKEKLSSVVDDDVPVKSKTRWNKTVQTMLLDQQVASGILSQLGVLDNLIRQCGIARDFEAFLFDIFDSELALSSLFEKNVSFSGVVSRLQYLETYLTVLNINNVPFSKEAWDLLRQITSDIKKMLYPVLVESLRVGISYFNPSDKIEDLKATLDWLCKNGKKAIIININRTRPPQLEEIQSLIRLKKEFEVPIAYIQRFFGHKQHWKDMALLTDGRIKIESSFWKALVSFV